jgi:hypothetical protein
VEISSNYHPLVVSPYILYSFYRSKPLKVISYIGPLTRPSDLLKLCANKERMIYQSSSGPPLVVYGPLIYPYRAGNYYIVVLLTSYLHRKLWLLTLLYGCIILQRRFGPVTSTG